jgi:hypothetical protein
MPLSMAPAAGRELREKEEQAVSVELAAVPKSRVTGHFAQDLQRLFDQQFRASYNTCLLGGGDEPVYLPADQQHPCHRLVYRHDYFASALHEIAHWCIAGPRRRLQVDYGYWYLADGRDNAQQARFEAVEAEPQALEWIFAAACDFPFRVSDDNLHGQGHDNRAFKQAIHARLLRYCDAGLPHRAEQFRLLLCRFYGTSLALEARRFDAALL